MRVTSVRARLLLWNIGILALVLFGFLFIAHVAIRTYLLSSLDQRLTGLADRSAHFLTRVNPNFRPPPLPSDGEAPAALNRNRAHRMPVRLFDRQGRHIDPFGQPMEDAAIPWDRAALIRATSESVLITNVREGDDPLRVLTRPLQRDGQEFGVMQVAISYAEAETLLESLTTLLLMLVPCALVVAALGGLLLTKRALQPVRQIVDAAAALNPDDLSQRLPVMGDDEFAHLAITMNGMLERIHTAFARLKELYESERRFTADASHELRTPLTALKANTSLALRGERTPAQYREALHAADQAADTMTRLVQDLLLLARSDCGQLVLDCQEVEPAMLLRDAVALLTPYEGQPCVSIEFAEGVGTIHGDPQHLHRLVVNLLENALRHTPTNGRVTLGATREGEMIVLVVADTGEGVTPEQLAHLGERFYRVDAARAREHGGAGLGLAICRSIVEAHHGMMTFDSAPGAGMTVTIALPSALRMLTSS
jgi:heavy metal sensor kinase